MDKNQILLFILVYAQGWGFHCGSSEESTCQHR